MSLTRDVVIRMLGESASAEKAIKAAADAAEVAVGTYKRAERQYAAAQRAEQAALEQRRANMREVGETATVLGAAMLAAAAISVRASAEFDKAMSEVAATSREAAASQDELRAAALQAGATTAYSATEAARAQTELLKAGMSVTDVLNGGLAGALALASAGQMSVADAAEIAATQLTVFQLNGRQAGHVADLLAAGAGKAQGGVQDLGLALEYAGLPAKGLGLSIEETTGALALFASNGLIGEKAGTAFRSMLQSMTSPTTAAQNAMDDLGLSFFDARGEFVGMEDVAGQLQSRLGTLTTEQRNAALSTIFGTTALGAAQTLYTSGAAGVEKWTAAVNDSGYAAEQAAKLQDNLAGDVEKLGGALSTALIEGGSGANEVLRWLTQAATGAVDAFADLPGPVEGVVVGFLGVVGSGTLMLGVVGSMIPRIAEARAALAGLGPAGETANRALGSVGRFAGYAAVAAAGIGLLSAAYDAMHPPIEIAREDTAQLTQRLIEMGTAADGARGSMVDFGVTQLVSQLQMVRPEIFSISQDLGSLGEAATIARLDFGDAAGQIDAIATAVFTSVQQSIADTDDALAQMVAGGHPDAAVAAFGRIMAAAEAQGIPLNELRERFPDYVAALQTYVGESTFTVDASGNVTNALGEQATAADLLKQQWDDLNGIGTDVVSAQAEWTLSLAGLTSAYSDMVNGVEVANYSLDLNTVAGATNAQQIVQVAQDARDLAAAIGNRDGWDAGVAASNDFRTALINQLVQAGYNQAAVEGLIGQIFILDQTNSTSDLQANDYVSPAVTAAKTQLEELDGTGATVTITTINRILNARPISEANLGGSGLVGLPDVPGRGGAAGGIVHAYALGGIEPMSGALAQIVPPNTLRVIGDRVVDDEFFIPDNNDPRSLALGKEWMRRRGLLARDEEAAILDRFQNPHHAPGLAHLTPPPSSYSSSSVTNNNQRSRSIVQHITSVQGLTAKQLFDAARDDEYLHG